MLEDGKVYLDLIEPTICREGEFAEITENGIVFPNIETCFIVHTEDFAYHMQFGYNGNTLPSVYSEDFWKLVATENPTQINIAYNSSYHHLEHELADSLSSLYMKVKYVEECLCWVGLGNVKIIIHPQLKGLDVPKPANFFLVKEGNESVVIAKA
jgi:hypothetical protein